MFNNSLVSPKKNKSPSKCSEKPASIPGWIVVLGSEGWDEIPTSQHLPPLSVRVNQINSYLKQNKHITLQVSIDNLINTK